MLEKIVSHPYSGQPVAILIRSDLDRNSQLASCYLAKPPGSDRLDTDSVHQTSVRTPFIRMSNKGNHMRLHSMTVPAPRETTFDALHCLHQMNDVFERGFSGFCASPSHQQGEEMMLDLHVDENSVIYING